MNASLNNHSPLFSLGSCYITPDIQALLEEFSYPIDTLIARHQSGDWGDVCRYDKKENKFALKHDLRLFSSYVITLNDETITIWIITEADRSSTTHTVAE